MPRRRLGAPLVHMAPIGSRWAAAVDPEVSLSNTLTRFWTPVHLLGTTQPGNRSKSGLLNSQVALRLVDSETGQHIVTVMVPKL